jgi:hypothetical protein
MTMVTKTNQIIHELVAVAANEQDRRGESRVAFFRPVSVRINGKSYSAFSRDISASAIGLIHNMELPLGEVEITVPAEKGRTVKLQARIERCESCGEGWYMSGGEFAPLKA